MKIKTKLCLAVLPALMAVSFSGFAAKIVDESATSIVTAEVTFIDAAAPLVVTFLPQLNLVSGTYPAQTVLGEFQLNKTNVNIATRSYGSSIGAGTRGTALMINEDDAAATVDVVVGSGSGVDDTQDWRFIDTSLHTGPLNLVTSNPAEMVAGKYSAQFEFAEYIEQ